MPKKQINPQIVKKVRGGDLRAYNEVVAFFGSSIYNIIYRVVKRREDAEDITQDVFIKIYKNIRKYNPAKPFSNWVFTIAIRTAYDWIRKVKRSPEISQLDYKILYNLSGSANIAKSAQGKIDVATALGKIRPEYSQILKLYYFEELTYEQIAKKTKTPLNTVKTRLSRAKQAIKRVI